MLIYKILTQAQWDELVELGETDGAPIDVADGFIHFSTPEQAQETADLHFTGQTGLKVAAFDTTALGDALRWDVSRGGAKFPHLYAKLRHADVVWCKDLPLVDGHHQFPTNPT